MMKFILSTLPIIINLVNSATALAPSGGRCGVQFNNATCSKMCCSGAGYCGTSEEHCSVPGNCQEAFGWCDSFIVPEGLDVSIGTRKYDTTLPFKINKCTVPKTLALTFDDGPTEYTWPLLDVLEKHQARGTFFVAGVNNGHGLLDIRYRPELIRMITMGHQVGSHTWSHPNLDKLSSAARKMEMYKTERSIVNVLGKMPTFMRPPMVICGDECMKDMRDLAYHVVGWEVDSQDWHEPQPSVEETTTRLIDEMSQRDNMFLIQHDTSQSTIDIVDKLLTQMPSDWKAVPLVECLGHSLDDAFQYPQWLEYKGVGTTVFGCLASGPTKCLPAIPFHSRESCSAIATLMGRTFVDCRLKDPTDPIDGIGLTIRAKEHCYQIAMLANATEKFCSQCKSDEECDSGLLKYKLDEAL